MATVTILLNTQRRKQDDTYPVVIRIAHQGKRKLIPTNCSVLEKDWDQKKGRVKSTSRDAHRFNALIEDKRAELMDQITKLDLEGRAINISVLGKSAGDGSFSAFIQARKEYFQARGNVSMQYKCAADRRELEEVNGSEVFYSDLTPDFLKRLELKFRAQGNGQNTVARKFKNLRTHYDRAILESIVSGPNPFKLVSFKKEPVKRHKLTVEEIKHLELLPLNGLLDLARDLFLFSFYCQGMRFENCLKLEKRQVIDAKVSYQMNKGKKHRSIGYHPKLETIITKYIDGAGRYLFPLLEDKEYNTTGFYHAKGSKNAEVNKYLKVIGASIGLTTSLSFHLAKHSFAYLAKQKGVDPHAIKDALGHSTYAVMEVYLKSLDDDYIDKAVKNIFD